MKKQGICIVERCGVEYLVMTPDGDVIFTNTKDSAERACKQWFQNNLGSASLGIGEIEWRGVDGAKS
jgi:hypothetical protein